LICTTQDNANVPWQFYNQAVATTNAPVLKTQDILPAACCTALSDHQYGKFKGQNLLPANVEQ